MTRQEKDAIRKIIEEFENMAYRSGQADTEHMYTVGMSSRETAERANADLVTMREKLLEEIYKRFETDDKIIHNLRASKDYQAEVRQSETNRAHELKQRIAELEALNEKWMTMLHELGVPPN